MCEDCHEAHGRLNLTKNHICIIYNPEKPQQKLPALTPKPPASPRSPRPTSPRLRTSLDQPNPVTTGSNQSEPAQLAVAGPSGATSGSTSGQLGNVIPQPPKPEIFCKYHEKEESKLYCDQCKVTFHFNNTYC